MEKREINLDDLNKDKIIYTELLKKTDDTLILVQELQKATQEITSLKIELAEAKEK